MRLLITSFVVLLGLMSPSFSKTSEVEVLEKLTFRYNVLINRICVSGYEFVFVCNSFKEGCEDFSNNRPNNYELTQIITENGGGKKC